MGYVCPCCQNGINNIGDRCQVCGTVFDPSQWPEEAYSLNGMYAHLVITWEDHHLWSSSSNAFIIGRESGDNVLQLNGKLVCNKHARVFYDNGHWLIEKIEGTLFINGFEVERKILQTKDQIQIGPYVLNVSISYKQHEIVPNENGVLTSPREVELNAERLYIGSDPTYPITIQGADKYHALLYSHNNLNEWWILDNGSSSGVKVNNERIRNKRLYSGDEITIAGINFLYTGNKLIVSDSFFEGLSLSFEKISATAKNGFQILNNLNFHVSPGEFIGILGPSGCGKSSLIQRIVGLAKFSSGNMYINGSSYSLSTDSYKDALAYLPQQNFLHGELTLKEEFSCFKDLHKNQDLTITEDSIQEVIRLLGLENDISKKVSDLSGGQQRRACIALELLRTPRLLVLDEPTSGLDPATEEEVMMYLRRISNQHKTVICSTHIMDNINLFDKVLVLSRGYQIFWGTPSELLSYFSITKPLNLYKLFLSGTPEDQLQAAEEFSQKYQSSDLFDKYSNKNSNLKKPLPAPRKKAVINEFLGYLKRMFFELLSFKNNGSILKTIWDSHFFIQLILQPILVAFVLKLSCAYTMLSYDGRKQVLFFAAVAVFWLGLNNSVRELVKERIPWRCLERLERISTSVYLCSKISWSALLCLIQVIMFSTFLFEFQMEHSRFHIIPNFQVVTPPTEDPVTIMFSFEIVLVLYIVGFMGACIGLSISSFFKKENAAVGLLPIILIPVIFFSQPIIQNDNFADISYKDTNGKYAKVAVAIENIMPCHAPEVLMDLINNEPARIEASTDNGDGEKRKTFDAWLVMLRNSLLYIVLAIAAMSVFQTRNEKKWEGR